MKPQWTPDESDVAEKTKGLKIRKEYTECLMELQRSECSWSIRGCNITGRGRIIAGQALKFLVGIA